MTRPANPARGGAPWPLLLALSAALSVGVVLWVRASSQEQHAAVRMDPPADDPIAFGEVVEFELTDQLDQRYGSADLAGRPWALAAIFTTCAGPCPKIVEGLRELRAELADTDVQFVCLSVDPAHDSPAVLREYAEKRGIEPERWRFLTGEESAIHGLLSSGFSMGVGRDDDAPHGFHVTHATQIVAVDREGRLRGWYSGLEPRGRKALAARLRHLASE